MSTPFARLGGASGQDVHLPHDALRDQPRSPDAPDGGRTGYYPGGAFEYSKSFDVPVDWEHRRVSLAFEGVYRDAMVYVNGTFAGQRPSGYSPFRISMDPYLKYGEINTVRVDARAHDDSRWYSGAGIYREVSLEVVPLTHLDLNGPVITTPDIDAERAVVVVAVGVVNEDSVSRTVRVEVSIVDPQGCEVARSTQPITLAPGASGTVRSKSFITAPQRWSLSDPHLYTATASLAYQDKVTQQAAATFGVRTLRLDPVHGLRINDESVKLRGACVHHDNGPLGAATIGDAEYRRAKLLKAAGFNALRSSHNTLSSQFLSACDRVGLLVMDEAFDVWTQPKHAHDYAVNFATWWERDIEAMVRKGINHPSVVMYSIGNEIAETGDAHGAEWGRRLADKVRTLDPTRLITNAVNPFLSVLPDVMKMIPPSVDSDGEAGLNEMLDTATMIDQLMHAPFVGERLESTFAVLDVAGLNYSEVRYELDHAEHPDRIMVGSETFPAKIAENWQLVETHPFVIGDFTWTGWDYLGEVGIGRTKYADETGALEAPYPWIAAAVGDIDITGQRRPISYYREIVWGLRTEPYIVVHPPRNRTREITPGMWSWNDAVSSWTWDVPPGTIVEVDVYAPGDEVELRVDGAPVGRALTGAGGSQRYLASFIAPYRPGVIEAIAYQGGVEIGRTRLRSATGNTRLTASAETCQVRHDDHGLAFIQIALTDAEGTLDTSRDDIVTVSVSGPGELVALASGRPATEERFDAASCTTFLGRALAIVRPTGLGAIEVTVTTSTRDTAHAVVTSVST